MRGWRELFERRKLRRLRTRLAPSDPRLAAYLRDYRPPERRAAVDTVRFVVVDTEATGLDVGRDRVLTLAAVAVVQGALVPGDSRELTIAHHEVGRQAAPVHGMVAEDLETGWDERDALGAFFAFLGSSVFVAHHAGFDHAILSAASRRHGGPAILNPVVDTEVLARRVELGPVPAESSLRYNLDAVAERFALETVARHTAAGDALLTAELLSRLLCRLGRRRTLTLGDITGDY